MIMADLRKVLCRFKKADYPYIVRNWGPLEGCAKESVAELSKMGKLQFVDFVTTQIKKKNWKDMVKNLELFYVEKYSSMKTWTVLKLQRLPGTNKKAKTQQDLESSLKSQLSLYFDSEVAVNQQDSAFWIQIRIRDASISSVTYLVHHTKTDFILLHGLKVKHAEYIMQVLLTVFSCSHINELQLKGRCVNSLLKLCLQKHDKKNANRFRLKSESPTRRGIKRRAVEISSDSEDEDSRIHHENAAAHDKRLATMDKHFGSDAQPLLETLEFKLETAFHGLQHAPAMALHRGQPFNCRVKFQGTSVLEGIKGLGKAGLAELPMREHLAKAHLLARNRIVLRQKTPAAQSLSQGSVNDSSAEPH